jgi:hypothetical protein
LILATGILGYFAYRQVGDMRASIRLAKLSANVAKFNAVSAFRLQLPIIFAITPELWSLEDGIDDYGYAASPLPANKMRNHWD